MSRQANSRYKSSRRRPQSAREPMARRNTKKPINPEHSQPITTKNANPWHSGLEISLDRQKYLTEQRKKTADLQKGIYPFNDIEPKLTCADIGWLLETHEDGRGPIDINDKQQLDRTSLDLRGADLQRADLRRFPLALLLGGLNWEEQRKLTTERLKWQPYIWRGHGLKRPTYEERYFIALI